ncbi:MAG: hypothetical protein ACREMU_04610, partial [Gemmatimonadaceae bacterium]
VGSGARIARAGATDLLSALTDTRADRRRTDVPVAAMSTRKRRRGGRRCWAGSGMRSRRAALNNRSLAAQMS